MQSYASMKPLSLGRRASSLNLLRLLLCSQNRLWITRFLAFLFRLAEQAEHEAF